MTIIHEDVDGLSISLTVPTGKSLQQAMPHLRVGVHVGTVLGDCCWGQLVRDVGEGC